MRFQEREVKREQYLTVNNCARLSMTLMLLAAAEGVAVVVVVVEVVSAAISD